MITPSEAAYLSSEVYKDEPSLGVLFSKSNHECLVTENFGFIGNTVIAFRGTKISLRDFRKDMITNAMMDQVDNLHSGKVHRGYYEAALELYPLIRGYIKNAKEITYVGHSMGGALAVSMAGIESPDYVYTFNAPKSGDSDFAKYVELHTKVFRFVSKRDWAQGVPSSTKNWAHVGNKIQLESSGHSLDKILKVL